MHERYEKLSTIINNFYISYRIGDDFAEVRRIGYYDEYGRLCDMSLVFRGTWQECKDYAKNHK